MKPYSPDTLPLQSLDWENLLTLIVNANRELARYDGVLQGIPNPTVLLSPLMTKEAVLSSKIEGTNTSVEEVLEYEASPKPESKRFEDIQEVLNYRQAMGYAVQRLNERPLSLNLFRDIHSILLDSVRGQNKARGDFRKTQNWIGRAGASIEQASHVPPSPEKVMDCMSNLEKYIHMEEKDRLVQLAIIHAQFELIHPFLDGNGRVGRILIPLFLYEKKILASPMFYISEYLETNRDAYYEGLKNISAQKDWNGWIEFFMHAVFEQAKQNTKKAKSILKLYEEMKGVITTISGRYSIQILDELFQRPIFNSRNFLKSSGISGTTLKRIIKELREQKIIDVLQAQSGSRASVYIFNNLLEIIG